jgi:hypothetical protein
VVSSLINSRAYCRADQAPKRSIGNGRLWLISFFVACWSLLCIGFLPDGQAFAATANTIGVRHSITVAVEPERGAASGTANSEHDNATINILVRILNYAPDLRFYGVVDGEFSDFDPGKGAATQEIWADRKCHINRGFPKIWVLAINGRITKGETVSDVAARPRQLGKWVPADEIVMQKDPRKDVGDPNQITVTYARTAQSRLSVKLTLTSSKCSLKED